MIDYNHHICGDLMHNQKTADPENRVFLNLIFDKNNGL